jgi:hypothetical protein
LHQSTHYISIQYCTHFDMPQPVVAWWRLLTMSSVLTRYSLLSIKSKSKLCYGRRLVGQSVFVTGNISAPLSRISLLPDSCDFVDVVSLLSGEDRPEVYNCCWSSPMQSFSGKVPAVLSTVFYCLSFESPPTWRARYPYLYPPSTRWPSIPPDTGLPLYRLLWLARLRWRYRPASTSLTLIHLTHCLIYLRHRLHWKHLFVFNQPLPSNEQFIRIYIVQNNLSEYTLYRGGGGTR